MKHLPATFQLWPVSKFSIPTNQSLLLKEISSVVTTTDITQDVNLSLAEWYAKINDILDTVAPLRHFPSRKITYLGLALLQSKLCFYGTRLQENLSQLVSQILSLPVYLMN